MGADVERGGPLVGRVALTGSSGLIGSALAAHLAARGWRVDRLVRRPPRPEAGEIRWDPLGGDVDAAALCGVDAVVHLAGANIAAGRWTAARKAAIRDSRVWGTRMLAECAARLTPRPRVLVAASAVGIYGDRGAEELSEDSPPGRGFLAEVCTAWEAATEPAQRAGIRVANMRLGMVLAATGGALPRMLTPFRLGVGGRLGSGRQYVSWIALPDAVRALAAALTNEKLHGPVNVTSPLPVTNREFTRTLGRVLGRPTLLPVPALAVRLLLGEMGRELLLSSARVLPRRLLAAGFAFELPGLEGALRALLDRGPSSAGGGP